MFPRPDATPRNSFSIGDDYATHAARQPHVDTSVHSSQPTEYLGSANADTLSPLTLEYNLPFTSRPLPTSLGTLENSVERTMAAGIGSVGSISEIPPVPSGVETSPRASVGSTGNQVNNHRSGSAAESDTWSPASLRANTVHSSEENMGVVKGEQGTIMSTHDEGDGSKDVEEDTDRPPAWSELKTKAGKERKRLPLACIACRRKKIRCSGEKPACKHCLRSRTPCIYKVTTRKAAPRTDYMAMLDKRLKRMEERVIKAIPKEDLPDLSVAGRAIVRPALLGQLARPFRAPSQKKRSADEAFVMELEDWTKSRDHKKGPENHARGNNPNDGESRLLTEGAESLPSMDLQEHLAEVFFDCLYGQSYLLLHKPSFMRKLKTGNVPPVLILAVCAISARFSIHPQVGGEPAFLRGDAWASPARAIVERRHYEPNITILTVMLILGLHYFGTCEGGLSWSFGGQALRMAYALQLHRELDHDPLGRKKDKASELSFTDREIRRRTMWACFLMDRFNSSGTERPSFGNEEYLLIQLPIKETHFQMGIPGPTENVDGGVPNPITPGIGQVSDPKENMGVAAYIIRAVVLWGRIVKYMNLGGKERDPYPFWSPLSIFADLRKQIDNFKESLPQILIYNNDNLQNHAAEKVANQFLYLHIICEQNMLFLHRFAIPVSSGARPPKDMPKPFLSEAGRLVVEAASQISLLIENAAGHLLTAPFAGYCAYAASTVQVWGIFSNNSLLEVLSKENLRHNYKYLVKMKKYWGMFHYMAESVKDIYRHFADSAIKGSGTHDVVTQSVPVFQYGDWFDKYPHGVSRTDWEASDPEMKKEAGAEAVMSHRSDLQSVEEFFASLSTPSKAEHQSRKIPRRHGKSVSEAKRHVDSQSHCQDATENQKKLQQQPPPDKDVLSCVLPSAPNQPSSHDFISPSHQVFDSQFNPHATFEYSGHNIYQANGLSQLDRQKVFGAYAGIDTNTVAAHGDLNNMIAWEGMPDLNGFSTDGFEPSSAWFMPFNMDPPQFVDIDTRFFMGDYGMDGSFSGPVGQDPSLGNFGIGNQAPGGV